MLDDEIVIRFLNGSEPDAEGRYITEIINFSLTEIERYHDFIQWIFPTNQKSQFNFKAPIISEKFSEIFLRDIKAQANFCRSCQMFLIFIGFSCNKEIKFITEIPNCTMFYDRPPHNYLRITRVLECLNQIGLSRCSNNLFINLKSIKGKNPKKIPLNTFKYWENTQIKK